MAKFVCSVCGYVHEGDSAPEKCPVCGLGASVCSTVYPRRNLRSWLESAVNI